MRYGREGWSNNSISNSNYIYMYVSVCVTCFNEVGLTGTASEHKYSAGHSSCGYEK